MVVIQQAVRLVTIVRLGFCFASELWICICIANIMLFTAVVKWIDGKHVAVLDWSTISWGTELPTPIAIVDVFSWQRRLLVHEGRKNRVPIWKRYIRKDF